MNILIYVIDKQLYGLNFEKITTAVLAVEITPLPPPSYILGTINFHGQMTSVINTRKIFGLPKARISLQRSILAMSFRQEANGVMVDEISTIKKFDKNELIPAKEILPDIEGLQFVLKKDDQFILIYDLDVLISSEVDFSDDECH